jgi:signal transduction histidine kinase/ActR/RegA family two-component response regulator
MNIQSFSVWLRSKRRWRVYFVLFTVLLSELLTLLMNSVNSMIWWGRIDRDLLIIGSIDALAVSVCVAPIVIYMLQHSFNLEQINRRLQQEIVERKQAEAQRRKLEELLQRAQRMEALGTLAGRVAHDLNNILGGLVGYPELLLKQLPEASPLRKPVLTIKQSGERAAAVVTDLLTLTRRGIVSESVLNLNPIVAEYLQTPEFEKLQALHPHVRFSSKLEPDLLNILGSAVHLGKMVMNLVSNAFEAAGSAAAGEVTLRTENVHLDRVSAGYEAIAAGDYVRLSISDNGGGIEPQDQLRIFEPFYTRKAMGRSGTGLGLAVVWGTVKDHRGFVDLYSQVGEGSLFFIYLPVTRRPVEARQAAPPEDAWRGRGESILVVDDEAQQRELAAEMLASLGYRVQSAPGGEDALRRLESESFDLVVLDMIMEGGIDGLETFRRILQRHPGQKAIIASGFSESERVTQARSLGAGAYLRKPYLIASLGLAVRRELERGQAQG